MFSSSESLVVALAQLMDHRELALLGGGGTYVALDCYSPSDPQSHVWDLQKVTPCLWDIEESTKYNMIIIMVVAVATSGMRMIEHG